MLEKLIQKAILLGTVISCASDPEYNNTASLPKFEITCNESEKTTYYRDFDGDKQGSKNDSKKICPKSNEPLGKYVTNNKDCNDNDTTIHYNAKEICDGKDNNCNGKTDENLNANCTSDCGDGFYDCIKQNDKYHLICSVSTPIIETKPEVCDGIDNDCNGLTDENISKVKEICDGLDNNCNGKTDEGFENIKEVCDGIDNNCNGIVDGVKEGITYKKYFFDKDGDGDGNFSETEELCKKENGYSENNFDCDDSKAEIKKGSVFWKYDDVKCQPLIDSLVLGKDDKIYFLDSYGKMNYIQFFNSSFCPEKKSDPSAKCPQSDNSFENIMIGNDGTIFAKNKNTFSALKNQGDKLDVLWSNIIQKCISDSPDSSFYSLALGFDNTVYVSQAHWDDDFVNEACTSLLAFEPKKGNTKFNTNISYDSYGSVWWAYNQLSLSIGLGEIIYAVGKQYYSTFNPNGTSKSTQKVNGIQINKELDSSAVFGSNGEAYFLTSNKTVVIYNVDTHQNNYLNLPGGEITPVIDSQGKVYTTEGKFGKAEKIPGPSNMEAKKGEWNISSIFGGPIDKGKVKGMVVTSNNTIYYFGDQGLYALNTENGETKWKIDVDPQTKVAIFPANMAIGENGNLYFCNAANNQIYAVCANDPLDPKSYWPMYRHDNQRTNNVNTEIK